MRILCDIDGVVADLMEGFALWLKAAYGLDLVTSKIYRHAIGECQDHGIPDVEKKFQEFMDCPDVYQLYVKPVGGSVEAVSYLRSIAGHEIVFATSVGKYAASYISKSRWIAANFPSCRMVAIDSDVKHYMQGDVAIDDRADIVMNYFAAGVKHPILFERSWSYTTKINKTVVQSLSGLVQNLVRPRTIQIAPQDEAVPGQQWKRIMDYMSECTKKEGVVL